MTFLEHDIDNDGACWCQPRLEQPCTHCPAERPEASCERCGGSGWEPMYDPQAPYLAIHWHKKRG